MKCLICNIAAVYGDLCRDCWIGLKSFKRTPKLLARAITYLGPKGKLATKRQRRANRKRNVELSRMIESQKADARDRNLRFERAVSKGE